MRTVVGAGSPIQAGKNGFRSGNSSSNRVEPADGRSMEPSQQLRSLRDVNRLLRRSIGRKGATAVAYGSDNYRGASNTLERCPGQVTRRCGSAARNARRRSAPPFRRDRVSTRRAIRTRSGERRPGVGTAVTNSTSTTTDTDRDCRTGCRVRHRLPSNVDADCRTDRSVDRPAHGIGYERERRGR